MRLIRINFFAPCTMRYTSIKYTNSKIADSSVDSVKTRREKILAYIEVREFSLFRSFGARCAARCDFYISAMTDIDTIISGSETIPLGPKPRLIWSTYSIPEVTCPQMVYCPSSHGQSPKQIKN